MDVDVGGEAPGPRRRLLLEQVLADRCWRRSLPVPVFLNRFAAVLLVFIFGMVCAPDAGVGVAGRSASRRARLRPSPARPLRLPSRRRRLGSAITSAVSAAPSVDRRLGRVGSARSSLGCRRRGVPRRAFLRGSSAFLSGASTIVMFRLRAGPAFSTLPTGPTSLDHPVEDLGAELRVGHLAAPELQRDLDLVALVR